MLQYNIVLHNIRKQLGLSMLEYCVCDSVYHLSKNPDMPRCSMSRETMAAFYDVSKRTVITTIDKMIQLGYIEKNLHTKHIRTTTKWYDAVITGNTPAGAEIAPEVKNLHLGSEKVAPDEVKNLHLAGAEIAPYNNIYNNTDNKNNNNNNVFDLKIGFDLFWDAYPRHTARPMAEKAYIKILRLKTKNTKQAMHDKIMQGVQYLVDDVKAQIVKKDYIPHASTWLNQERWQDEYRGPLYIKHHKNNNKPLKPFTPITMDDNDNNNPTTNSAGDGATNTGSAIQEHASTTRSSGGGLGSIFGEMQRTEAEFDTEHQHL